MRLGVGAALVRGRLVPGDIEVADGGVRAVGLPSGGSSLAIPGLIDLQVNGFGGLDLRAADERGYARAGEALLACGVTAYQPTFITAAMDDLLEGVGRAARLPPIAGPRIVGVHLEGPFLSPERLGTHPAEWQRDPDLAELDTLVRAGPVRYVTLAPELPGALDAVKWLTDRGVVVSAGHTNATAEEAHAAFDAGVGTVTHLFNAMRGFSPRDPGIAAVALAREDVVVQLILDGHHVAPDTARMVRAAAGGRLALVTDGIAAAGVGDGSYLLGDVEVNVHDGVARRSDGTLAGSTLTMDAAVRNYHALGASLEEAVLAATAVPAAVLGRSDLGTLDVGEVADITVLDDNLEVQCVLIDGEVVHERQ